MPKSFKPRPPGTAHTTPTAPPTAGTRFAKTFKQFKCNVSPVPKKNLFLTFFCLLFGVIAAHQGCQRLFKLQHKVGYWRSTALGQAKGAFHLPQLQHRLCQPAVLEHLTRGSCTLILQARTRCIHHKPKVTTPRGPPAPQIPLHKTEHEGHPDKPHGP